MSIEAMKQALECLESLQGGCTDSDDGTVEAITVWCPEVIEALRTAIQQAESEPAAYLRDKINRHALLAADCPGSSEVVLKSSLLRLLDKLPPTDASPAPGVPMTDEQLRDCLRTCQHDTVENLRVRWLYAKEFARAVEAHHGITAQAKKEAP